MFRLWYWSTNFAKCLLIWPRVSPRLRLQAYPKPTFQYYICKWGEFEGNIWLCGCNFGWYFVSPLVVFAMQLLILQRYCSNRNCWYSCLAWRWYYKWLIGSRISVYVSSLSLYLDFSDVDPAPRHSMVPPLKMTMRKLNVSGIIALIFAGLMINSSLWPYIYDYVQKASHTPYLQPRFEQALKSHRPWQWISSFRWLASHCLPWSLGSGANSDCRHRRRIYTGGSSMATASFVHPHNLHSSIDTILTSS